jgi:hypothetical protein
MVDFRPVSDVVRDLRVLITDAAALLVIDECCRIIEWASYSEDSERDWDRACALGKGYAAGAIIRTLADAYGVHNVIDNGKEG